MPRPAWGKVVYAFTVCLAPRTPVRDRASGCLAHRQRCALMVVRHYRVKPPNSRMAPTAAG